MNKSILTVIRELAKDLRQIGVMDMDDMTMHEFDFRCLPPEFTPAQIKNCV